MRKKRKSNDNGVVIATVIIALAFMISAGYLLGGDNLVNAVFKEKSEGATFYFLSTDTFDDSTIARQNAELIRLRGGAGYVDMREGNRVILAVYPDEQSAKSVYEKMGDNSIVVWSIDIPSVKISMKNKELNRAVEEGLEYFDIAFDALYTISNSLSDGTMSIEDIKVQKSVLTSRIEEIKSVFYENTAGVGDNKITEIKVAIVTCLALVDGVEIGGLASTLSSLRRQTVQLVYCHSALVATLAE
ncbi:MAG: hypothetical protein J6U74_01265 [Clostridia bacterium]|nr:hypothetical protein [Clostridia bacterium]